MSQDQPGRAGAMPPGIKRGVLCLLGALLLPAAAAAQTATAPAVPTPAPPALTVAAEAADPGGQKREADVGRRGAAEAARRRGTLGPATRDPELAAYYNAFALRIECLSERSYPQAARGRKLQLAVTVSVLADGRLEKALIERSSGNPDVDNAVLALARSAAPYEAFSRPLAERYAVLDISSRWQFAYAKSAGGRADQCRPGGQ